MIINAAEIGLEIDKAVALGFEASAIQAQTFISTRVFVEHQTTDGTPFGKYKSDSYKKFRQSLGRQTNTKDLQLSGDLLKSIKQVENQVVFNDDRSAKIANWQETSDVQINKPIFDLNQNEIDDCIIVCDEVFTDNLLPALEQIKIVI